MMRHSWENNRLYQQKSLRLVMVITAICITSSLVVFTIGDYYRRAADTRRDAQAASVLLADLIKMPLYSGATDKIVEIADRTASAFGLSKIVVTDTDGKVILDYPPNALKTGYAAKASIAFNSGLDPSVSIFGQSPSSISSQFAEVTVFASGKTRFRESMATLSTMCLAGVILWVVTSFIGYIMARRTTAMFDLLLERIDSVGLGENRYVSVSDLEEGVRRIAERINAMGQNLYAREKENIELHKQIAEKMEGRARQAENLMQAKLFQANKMSSLGMLVSSIAHEINNPNSIIQLQAATCARITESSHPLLARIASEEGNFYLDGMPYEEAMNVLTGSLFGIVEQSKRINSVVKGLREYVVGDGNGNLKKNVPIQTMIQRSLILLQSQVKQTGCVLEQDIPGELAIYCNQFQIESVIINLLQNAMRAVAGKPEAERRICLVACEVGGMAVIQVKDNGMGISEEDLPYLCDPFFSRHIDQGGTGLGLFIAKGILDDHNATIEFISTVGEGTQVCLRFPHEENV